MICTFGDDYARIAEDLELVAGGTLDAEVSLDGFPVHLCDLRVVPVGYDGPDFSSFTGPVVAASTYDPDHYSAPFAAPSGRPSSTTSSRPVTSGARPPSSRPGAVASPPPSA